jgi:hypothetical protein
MVEDPDGSKLEFASPTSWKKLCFQRTDRESRQLKVQRTITRAEAGKAGCNRMSVRCSRVFT